jgi:hypothetical protein
MYVYMYVVYVCFKFSLILAVHMNMEMSVERMEKKLCGNKANTRRAVGYAWWLRVRFLKYSV